MAKLIPFRRRRNREAAAYVLALSARLERSKLGSTWTPPADHQPERLGNLLQHLLTKRPALVFVLESIVAEMIALID
jgi:hypothetical protein